MLPRSKTRPLPWLEKFYTFNEDWDAEDRRKLLAFARDPDQFRLRRTPVDLPALRAIAPFANLAAAYRAFDWDGPPQKGTRPVYLPSVCLKKRQKVQA
ncbi:MAG: hypothetical protein R2855_10085 [Thermomicrobiales bacterium]